MIDLDSARRYVARMSWPEGAKRPYLRMREVPEGYDVLLHEQLKDGWTDIARVVAFSPERALMMALEDWIDKKGLHNQPKLFQEIKRLTN
jgi:hypothetical protein